MSILLHLRARWALKAQLIPLLLHLTLCSLSSHPLTLSVTVLPRFFCFVWFCFVSAAFSDYCSVFLCLAICRYVTKVYCPFSSSVFHCLFDGLTYRLVPEPTLKTQTNLLRVIQTALRTGNVYYHTAESFSATFTLG